MWLHERVEKSMPHWDPEEERVTTDEAHLQAVGSWEVDGIIQ